MNNEVSSLTESPDIKGLRRAELESDHSVSYPSSLFIAQQHISQLTVKRMADPYAVPRPRRGRFFPTALRSIKFIQKVSDDTGDEYCSENEAADNQR